ncbi:hypothetical protein HY484_04670 [Candidatus Woesearchaeota archaeon]|nr:hypothetical protein [Candidatus Woesearchaeota archaeon]
MEELKEKLSSKGWNKREIEKTITILQQAHKKKTNWTLFLDELLIWISILIAIIGNFVLSVILVPFLIIMKGTMLYLTIMIMGTAFGIIFTLLLRAIEKIELQKHIMTGIVIPVIGLINMYIIARLSNQLIIQLQLKTTEHNPALVSMVYIFAFLVPYLVTYYLQEFKREQNVRTTT